MSGHSSHGAHEADLGFDRVLYIIPVSMALLVAYVCICLFTASASLSTEMNRKQARGAVMLHKPLDAFRAHEDSSMHGYAMDSENNTVKIPIEHAMEMMVQEASKAPGEPKATAK